MKNFEYELKNLEFAFELAKEVYTLTKNEDKYKEEISKINSARVNLFNDYCRQIHAK